MKSLNSLCQSYSNEQEGGVMEQENTTTETGSISDRIRKYDHYDKLQG